MKDANCWAHYATRAKAAGLHDKLADDANIKLCKCRCGTCGQEVEVNGAECLRGGWPKCCGYTMSLLT